MKDNMKIRKFNIKETDDIIQIWDKCGLLHPPNNPVEEMAIKTRFQPDLFLVGEINGKVMATIMLGFEGRRGWINSLCVLPEYQGKGYGSDLMQHGMQILRKLGAPKINLLIRPGNSKVREFYKKLGFEIEEVILMAHRFTKEK